MVVKLKDIEHLPNWPRLLSREQAAAYVGVSPNLFDAEMKKGLWPQPIKRGDSKRARLTWDRLALDRSIDGGVIVPVQATDDFEAARAASEATWNAPAPDHAKRRRSRGG